jgi:hypothetical protein
MSGRGPHKSVKSACDRQLAVDQNIKSPSVRVYVIWTTLEVQEVC